MQVTCRLLLPFTQEVDALAIDQAVVLASQSQATLVLLALVAEVAGKTPRPELLEQAQDFFLLARHKARRYAVPVEASLIYTQQAVRSIEAFAREMDCEGIVLFWQSQLRSSQRKPRLNQQGRFFGRWLHLLAGLGSAFYWQHVSAAEALLGRVEVQYLLEHSLCKLYVLVRSDRSRYRRSGSFLPVACSVGLDERWLPLSLAGQSERRIVYLRAFSS